MVFRWAATPNYAPLYSNLSSEDASAVVEQLDADGVPYELGNGGSTIMVPQDQVYSTRISLSGEGLPEQQRRRWLLAPRRRRTSPPRESQEQTDFKRAMEGELAKTIEAIDGVDTAVVHLALPEKQVFADEQDPATASVLVDTAPGRRARPRAGPGDRAPRRLQHRRPRPRQGHRGRLQRQGPLDRRRRRRRRRQHPRPSRSRTSRTSCRREIQTMLDRVVGPGNSTVQVTADLDFDKAVTETTTYTAGPDAPGRSPRATSTETYNGPGGGAGGAGGVVGPDGQMDSGAGRRRRLELREDSATPRTTPSNSVVEHRESAPGSVDRLHVARVVDTEAARNIDPGEVEDLIAAAVGIDAKRGDTVEVTTMPFDRTAEAATAAELKAAAAADKNAERMDLIRKTGMGLPRRRSCS